MSHEQHPHAPLWYRALRRILFQFDAETTHRLVLSLLVVSQAALARRLPYSSPALRQEIWGLTFPNPIGLAAGFDKDARAPLAWSGLGFGFAELGTITAQGQAGNPRPRVFRLTQQHALINRLGFNNAGAVDAARRLSRLQHARRRVPLGINIGKSRITPVERAVEDYISSFRLLAPHADYMVINVSSPNTPGLRDLQAGKRLGQLLHALQEENTRLPERRPLLVKLSPDLEEDDLAETVETIEYQEIDGVVATNTTIRREVEHPLAEQDGGLSGAPLRELATETIRRVHHLSGGRVPIVGVGGISTATDAYDKIRAGASLLQIYTGMIYQGPTLPVNLCRGLEKLLARDNVHSLRCAVGTQGR